MSQYAYPYLNPVQTRTQEVNAWQQELANVIESVFAKGAKELDEVVRGLNGTRVRPPNGDDWTQENFTAVMREQGA
jgi:hypothetical protein